MRLRTIAILSAILITLAAYHLFYPPTAPVGRSEPRPFVWSFELDDLASITVDLPLRGKRETWVRYDNRQWYFAGPDGPRVDLDRWGGVPLILTGPRANRLIAAETPPEQLTMFGLQSPAMVIMLTLRTGITIEVEVGHATPDTQAYYIKLAESDAVYTVAASWYGVIERLVLDPPYPDGGA